MFVAEIGLNYEGSLDIAGEMMRQAKAAGADAVKFQFGWRSKENEINFLNPERIAKLQEYARQWNITFFASIISDEGWEWAQMANLPLYKIAARTVVERPDLCEKVLKSGKITYVSLGRWNEKTLPFPRKTYPNIKYVYCRSSYPSQPQDLVTFPANFIEAELEGYSDHCLGIEMCLAAIARGARYIEKHFTLNKSSISIRDHVLSATPDEFKKMTEIGRPMMQWIQAIKQT